MLRTAQKLLAGVGGGRLFTESFLARLSQLALGFATSLVLARGFGAADVGRWAVAASVLALTAQFSLLGSAKTLLIRVPESKASGNAEWRASQNASFIATVLAGGMIATLITLALSFGWFLEDSLLSRVPWIAVWALVLLNALRTLQTSTFAAHAALRAFNIFGLSIALYPPVLLVGISVFEVENEHRLFVVLLSLEVAAVVLGFVLFRSAGTSAGRLSWRPEALKRHLKWSLRYFASGFAGSVEFAILPIAAAYLTAADVGVLAVAIRIAGLAALVQMVANLTYGPQIASTWSSKGVEAALSEAHKQTIARFPLVTMACIVVALIGRQGLPIVFGPPYAAGGAALMVLVFSHWVDNAFGPVALFLNMTTGQNEMLVVAASTLAVGGATAFFMIPLWGIEGAALSTLTTTTARNAVASLLLRRQSGTDLFILTSRRRLRA